MTLYMSKPEADFQTCRALPASLRGGTDPAPPCMVPAPLHRLRDWGTNR